MMFIGKRSLEIRNRVNSLRKLSDVAMKTNPKFVSENYQSEAYKQSATYIRQQERLTKVNY